MRRAGSVLNPRPTSVISDPVAPQLWKPSEGQGFWLRLEDEGGPVRMPRTEIILWGIAKDQRPGGGTQSPLLQEH